MALLVEELILALRLKIGGDMNAQSAVVPAISITIAPNRDW